MSNKSNLYRSLRDLQSRLSADLENVNSYLSGGNATTVVKYYNSRKQLINTKRTTSSWTTALGKQRVKNSHEYFIDMATSYDIPIDARSIVVESPFVSSGVATKSINYLASRNVAVVKASV